MKLTEYFVGIKRKALKGMTNCETGHDCLARHVLLDQRLCASVNKHGGKPALPNLMVP